MSEKTEQPVDLFIIGGGINGCGIARDASGRGLTVALAEMNDLAGATSSASTKLFHGGLRYLEYFKFRLVREALTELDLDAMIYPCPKGGKRFRPLATDLGGKTRFPLLGVHAAVSCRQCHPGAEVGRFVPTPIECVDCHQRDLQNANNPNHLALGWTFDCNRCHQPSIWNAAELDPNFPN